MFVKIQFFCIFLYRYRAEALALCQFPLFSPRKGHTEFPRPQNDRKSSIFLQLLLWNYLYDGGPFSYFSSHVQMMNLGFIDGIYIFAWWYFVFYPSFGWWISLFLFILSDVKNNARFWNDRIDPPTRVGGFVVTNIYLIQGPKKTECLKRSTLCLLVFFVAPVLAVIG